MAMMNTHLALIEHLRGRVQTLAGEIGERNVVHPEALEAAASYIAHEWRKQGYAVRRMTYEAAGMECANLEITRTGSSRADEILLIGAHYDSVVGSPGANDNASGVAALLEISGMFTAVDPAMTVRFVSFVNEEPPFFQTPRQGSMQYADLARRRGDDIRMMVSLETIGSYSNRPGSQRYPPLFGLWYPNRADFVGIVSDFRSARAMFRLAAAFRANSDFPLQTVAMFRFIRGVSWSDHWSFWRKGYRALMITDTALYRYRHYHAASDTPDKLAFPQLAQVTAGLFGAFVALAREP